MTDENGRVIFPIQRTVVESGRDFVKTLNVGDVVKCHYCGRPIEVKPGTVYIQRENGMEMVRCQYPGCKKGVSVLYYFDKVEKPDDTVKVKHHFRPGKKFLD